VVQVLWLRHHGHRTERAARRRGPARPRLRDERDHPGHRRQLRPAGQPRGSGPSPASRPPSARPRRPPQPRVTLTPRPAASGQRPRHAGSEPIAYFPRKEHLESDGFLDRIFASFLAQALARLIVAAASDGLMSGPSKRANPPSRPSCGARMNRQGGTCASAPAG
jgi:hypothetical protein